MLVKKVRLSFPSLFVATAFDANQAKKYSATFIVEKGTPDHKKLLAEIERVATERWGQKALGILQQLAAQNKAGLRDGMEKAAMDGFGEGVAFFNASSQKRPGVYDRDQTPLTADDGRPYAGCYVNALVEAWAQDKKEFGRRINFELRGVQFDSDGGPFGGGGRPAAADEFPKLEEREPGSDDDIPWPQGEAKATAGWMD